MGGVFSSLLSLDGFWPVLMALGHLRDTGVSQFCMSAAQLVDSEGVASMSSGNSRDSRAKILALAELIKFYGGEPLPDQEMFFYGLGLLVEDVVARADYSETV